MNGPNSAVFAFTELTANWRQKTLNKELQIEKYHEREGQGAMGMCNKHCWPSLIGGGG